MNAATERELDMLIALFVQAETEIARQLAEAKVEGDRDTPRNRRQKQRQIRAVLGTLMQNTLGSGEPGDLEDEKRGDSPAWRLIREAYREGTDEAARSMERNGIPAIRTGFTQTHQDAAEVLYGNLRDRMTDAVGFVGRRSDDVFRRVALAETMQKLIQGRTVGRTAAAIEGQLAERGVKAFRDSRGAEWDLGSYARMVARTTTREATSMGTLNRLAENGIELVRISRHANSCDICKKFEGRIFSMTGRHEEYPRLDEIPPFHPNCGHTLTSYIDAEDLVG